MSLVGFKAQNHAQQVLVHGPRSHVDDRGTTLERLIEKAERVLKAHGRKLPDASHLAVPPSPTPEAREALSDLLVRLEGFFGERYAESPEEAAFLREIQEVRAALAASPQDPIPIEVQAAFAACDVLEELIRRLARVDDRTAGEWMARHLETIRRVLAASPLQAQRGFREVMALLARVVDAGEPRRGSNAVCGVDLQAFRDAKAFLSTSAPLQEDRRKGERRKPGRRRSEANSPRSEMEPNRRIGPPDRRSGNDRRAPLQEDERVERVASELALIDGYDPNEIASGDWAAFRLDYRAKAARVLAALKGEEW